VFESAPEACSVDMRGLATGQRRAVRVAALRSQPSESNADFVSRLDSIFDASDSRWQQAVADTKLLPKFRVTSSLAQGSLCLPRASYRQSYRLVL